MKKVMALILGVVMMLSFASCAKKVEVPSKSDVKKAAAEEYDMEFKVDSQDISGNEKEAEWVLISKDGSLEVTVTWNAKKPNEFEFDDRELEPVIETDETEESTEETTEETTESTTEETTEAIETGVTIADGVKIVNFDEMNFYLNGVKYTLGKTTLQDMIDQGAPFKNGELDNADNNLKARHQASLRLDIGDGTAVVYVFNDSENGMAMRDCFINEIYYAAPLKGKTQSVLTFDFPLNLTMDELKANSGEPNENPYHNEDDPKFVYDKLRYTKKSTKYLNKNTYSFDYTNGELRYVTITYIP